MRYHLTRQGLPAPCEATQRACPLGGEHFESMEAASVASVAATFPQATLMPFGKYKGRPLAEVARDRAYVAFVLYKTDLPRTHPELCRELRREAAVNDLRRDFYRT